MTVLNYVCTYVVHNQFYTNVDDIPDDDEHAMDEGTKRIVATNNSSEKTLGGQKFGDDEPDFHGQTFGDDEVDFHGQTFGDDEPDFHGQTFGDDEDDDDEVDFQLKKPASLSSNMKVMYNIYVYNNYYVHTCTCISTQTYIYGQTNM